MSVLACWAEPNSGGRAELLVMMRSASGWQQSRVPFARSPVLQLGDLDGHAVEQGGVVVTVELTSGDGTLGGTTAVATADTGIAVFEDILIAGSVGEKTLTFSAPGLVSAFSTVQLTAGPPANLLHLEGNNQAALAGTPVDTPPSVQLSDLDGNPVPGEAVTFSVSSGHGAITDSIQVTDATGIASVGSWTLGAMAGANTLSVKVLTGLAVVFTADGIAEPPPGSGCFTDEQGRTYCLDP